MRAVFGVVSLLLVLAVVLVLSRQQLKGTAQVKLPAVEGLPAMAASGTPAQQAKQIEAQVQAELNKAVQQGAARASDLDQ